jgi:hypothetical protein
MGSRSLHNLQMLGLFGNVLAALGVPQAILRGIFINKQTPTTVWKLKRELKERAKHALEFAGKQPASVESAIKSVEGVRSLLIEDMPDDILES